MPMYDWKCAKCEKLSLSIRPLSEIDVPPEKCEHCGAQEFTGRVITRPENVKGFILMEGGAGGFHDHEYTRFRSIR